MNPGGLRARIAKLEEHRATWRRIAYAHENAMRRALEALVAKATEALERTQHEHEGNLRERERARLADERQAALFPEAAR